MAEPLRVKAFFHHTELNMAGYGFSVGRISPYKDRIEKSVLTPENAGHRKRVF